MNALIFGGIAWSVLVLVLTSPWGAFMDWLFPRVEVYAESPRRRRFAWQFFVSIIGPLVVGIVVWLITGAT